VRVKLTDDTSTHLSNEFDSDVLTRNSTQQDLVDSCGEIVEVVLVDLRLSNDLTLMLMFWRGIQRPGLGGEL
jgi:hypothetical protein